MSGRSTTEKMKINWHISSLIPFFLLNTFGALISLAVDLKRCPCKEIQGLHSLLRRTLNSSRPHFYAVRYAHASWDMDIGLSAFDAHITQTLLLLLVAVWQISELMFMQHIERCFVIQTIYGFACFDNARRVWCVVLDGLSSTMCWSKTKMALSSVHAPFTSHLNHRCAITTVRGGAILH